MGRAVYVDCFSGASGDMLLGAVLDVLVCDKVLLYSDQCREDRILPLFRLSQIPSSEACGRCEPSSVGRTKSSCYWNRSMGRPGRSSRQTSARPSRRHEPMFTKSRLVAIV